jgi:hypothetical protein
VWDQIVFIGVAQEKANVFRGTKVNGQFQFSRDKRFYVNHYYLYIDDEDFGSLFLFFSFPAPRRIGRGKSAFTWGPKRRPKGQTF